MSGGFLDLDHRVDQRGAGLRAELRRFALDLAEIACARASSVRLGIADAFVEGGKQSREPVLLLRDPGRGCRDASLASTAASRIQSSSGLIALA